MTAPESAADAGSPASRLLCSPARAGSPVLPPSHRKGAPMSPDLDGEDEGAPGDGSGGPYRVRLAAALRRALNAEGTDIWSDEAAMGEVGRQFRARGSVRPVKRVLDVGAGTGPATHGKLCRPRARRDGGRSGGAAAGASPPRAGPARLPSARISARSGPTRALMRSCRQRLLPPRKNFPLLFTTESLPTGGPAGLSGAAGGSLMRGPEASLCLSVFAAAGGPRRSRRRCPTAGLRTPDLCD